MFISQLNVSLNLYVSLFDILYILPLPMKNREKTLVFWFWFSSSRNIDYIVYRL